MEAMPEGCRLCLDPFAESFTTIDSPELMEQMEKVFCFSIEPKQGYCSGVCQSCSYAISEFYQYSEKVRENQEILNGTATNSDPTVDSKIGLENEMLSASVLPETTEDACEPTDAVSGEEFPTEDSMITLESVKTETLSDSKHPKTIKAPWESKDEFSGETEVPTLNMEITIESVKIETHSELWQEERNEQDQLFNKHFRMICDLCKTSVATYTALQIHFSKVHNRRNGYVVCCNKKLFKRDQILNHIDFHADPDVFGCEVCGNKYKTKNNLNMHMLHKHSSEEQRPFKCYQCPQSFALKSVLAKHMKGHVKVKCPKCNKMFSWKESLKRHLIDQHSGMNRTMVCDTCGKELKGVHSFRYHMNTAHPNGNEEFQCNLCPRKYSHSLSLHAHKLQAHAEPKHECEFCGKKFKRAMSLRNHRIKHTGEIFYSCEYCGKMSNNRDNAYRHIKLEHPIEWAQKKLKASQKSGT